MKTLILTLAKTLMVLVVLMSLNVNLYANGKNNKNVKVTLAKDITTEPVVKLENWMLSADLFTLSSINEAVKLEPWMLDAAEFVNSNRPDSDEVEQKVELKDWMTDQTLWKSNSK